MYRPEVSRSTQTKKSTQLCVHTHAYLAIKASISARNAANSCIDLLDYLARKCLGTVLISSQCKLEIAVKQKKNESSNEKHIHRSRFQPAMPQTSFLGHNCANGLVETLERHVLTPDKGVLEKVKNFLQSSCASNQSLLQSLLSDTRPRDHPILPGRCKTQKADTSFSIAALCTVVSKEAEGGTRHKMAFTRRRIRSLPGLS